MNKVIVKQLRELGVPASVKGYVYLQDAIDTVVKDRDAIYGTTKTLYPSIARKHQTTAPRVERAIRHAIEIAFDRHTDKLKALFGSLMNSASGKVTNSEFIATVADEIVMEESQVAL